MYSDLSVLAKAAAHLNDDDVKNNEKERKKSGLLRKKSESFCTRERGFK